MYSTQSTLVVWPLFILFVDVNKCPFWYQYKIDHADVGMNPKM